MSGCRTTELNPEHCGVRGGDAYCRMLDGDRPFCMADEPRCHPGDALGTRSGCVSETVRNDVDLACHWPCGANSPDDCMLASTGTTSTAGDDETGGLSDMVTTTLGSGGEAITTMMLPPGTCLRSGDCIEEDAPICVAEACVSCASADAEACRVRDPATPYCWEDRCSACDPATNAGCDAARPFCDPIALACRGCLHHEECGRDALCVFSSTMQAEGECMSDGFYVDADAFPGGDGSPEMPFASVSEALAATSSGTPTVLWLRGGEYFDTIVLANRAVALAPAPDATSDVVFVGGYNTEAIFTARGAVLQLERIRIEATNTTPVFSGDHAKISLHRTALSHNEAGLGIISLGEFACENCILAYNGFSGTRRPLLDLSLSRVNIVSSTIYENRAADGVPLHFQCSGNSVISVRNTIMISSQSYVPFEAGTESGDGAEASASGSADSGTMTSGTTEHDDLTGDAEDSTSTGASLDASGTASDGSESESSSGGLPWFEPPPGASRSSSCRFLARNSAVDGQQLVGAGSILLQEPDDGWFAGARGLNFKLSASGRRLFGTLGEWAPGDSLVDFNGKPRARREGAREPAGAVLP